MQIELLFASVSARNLVQLFFPDITGVVVNQLNSLHKKVYQIIKWRKNRFDYVLSGAHLNSSKTAMVAWLVRPKKSLGMKNEKYSFLYDVSLEKRKEDAYDDYSILFESLGVNGADIEYGRIHFCEELAKMSSDPSAVIHGRGIVKIIAFANGADNIRRRNWKPSIKRVPNRLIWDIFSKLKQQIDAKFVLLGIEEDTFPENMKTESSVIDLRGQRDILRLITILHQIDVLICNDTGIMHLAHFCGTPYVALFGPTNPKKFAPVGVQANIVQAYGPCAPCHPEPSCHSDHCRLLSQLEVDIVIGLVKDILNRRAISSAVRLPIRT
jgi:ADP-heptose:LPS heptosyltransferase